MYTPSAVGCIVLAACGVVRAQNLSLVQQLANAESVVDRLKLLPDDSSFVFNFNVPQPNPGKGGEIIGASRQNFPALVGTGMSWVVGRFGPCGMLLLHHHLRATELQLVVEGTIIVGLHPEAGVQRADGTPRIITNTMLPFQLMPFYQGDMHVQYNPNCENATFVSAFNDEDIGTQFEASSVFDYNNDIIAANFGEPIDGAEIDRVRNSIPPSIALGVEQCLIKCGIHKRNGGRATTESVGAPAATETIAAMAGSSGGNKGNAVNVSASNARSAALGFATLAAVCAGYFAL